MAKSVGELFKNLGFIFKLVESIFCIVNCAMIADITTGFYDLRARDATIVAAGGYAIICIALLLLYIFDETHHLYELIVIFVGFVINLVVGILCIVHFADDTHRTGTLIISIFATACGVVMIFDWIRELKNN